MTNDPKILGLAFLGGIIPSLLWLWFWLKEDKKNPEPVGLLSIVFIMGMASIAFVLPLQRFVQTHFSSHELQLILWASIEEIMKFLAVLLVLFHTTYDDEPIDWPIYMITAALGFAAVENALFLIKPLSLGQNTVGLLTGQLRFIGSTLLHTVSSGILGLAIGISMHLSVFKRKLYLIFGLLLAIALHSVFNFFIIKANQDNFLEILRVFGFLWVSAIVIMLVFEKVRRMI